MLQVIAPHHKPIGQYYRELEGCRSYGAKHELALKTAFQKLLATVSPSVGWVLIPEEALANGKRPDGTLRDSFRLPRGYWEAKDTGDDLNRGRNRKSPKIPILDLISN